MYLYVSVNFCSHYGDITRQMEVVRSIAVHSRTKNGRENWCWERIMTHILTENTLVWKQLLYNY